MGKGQDKKKTSSDPKEKAPDAAACWPISLQDDSLGYEEIFAISICFLLLLLLLFFFF